MELRLKTRIKNDFKVFVEVNGKITTVSHRVKDDLVILQVPEHLFSAPNNKVQVWLGSSDGMRSKPTGFEVSFDSAFRVGLSTPKMDEILNGWVEVSGFIENAIGPVALTTHLNGKEFDAEVRLDDNTRFSFRIPPEQLTEGKQQLSVAVLDRKGEQKQAADLTFYYKPRDLDDSANFIAFNDMADFLLLESQLRLLSWASSLVTSDPSQDAIVVYASDTFCKQSLGYCHLLEQTLSIVDLKLEVVVAPEQDLLQNIPRSAKLVILLPLDSELNADQVKLLREFSTSGGGIVSVGQNTFCERCIPGEVQKVFFEQMCVDITLADIGRAGGTDVISDRIDRPTLTDIESAKVDRRRVFILGDNAKPLLVDRQERVIAVATNVDARHCSR